MPHWVLDISDDLDDAIRAHDPPPRVRLLEMMLLYALIAAGL